MLVAGLLLAVLAVRVAAVLGFAQSRPALAAAIWRAVGRLVGFDADTLPPTPIRSRAPERYDDLLDEVVRLRAHAAALEERNARLRRKRRRLKRRLADATSG